MRQAILFLAANPSRSSPRALDQECAAIEHELRVTTHRDDFEFRSKWAVTADDMMRQLADLQPSVIHFRGHDAGPLGSSAATARMAAPAPSGIYLQGDHSASQLVNGRALKMMIRSAAASPRVVVLDACYSAPQAEALRDVVDCVVGMAGAIDDDAAHSFAVRFYRALGNRRSVGNAVDQAVATLAAKGIPDEAMPRCLTRDDVDKYRIFLNSSKSATARRISDSSRPGASTRGRPAAGRANLRPPASDPGGTRYTEGAGGLHADEIIAMLRGSRSGDPPTSVGDLQAAGALAPYLAGTELSADAYREWLTRVCEQPDDD